MNTKKLKQKELIKKLFDKIKVDNKLEKDVKLRINENGEFRNTFKVKKYLISGKIELIVTLNLNAIKSRINLGYSNGYYHNRAIKINKFILKNRHSVYRFVILHEIKHALDYLIGYNVFCLGTEAKAQTEKRADDFALDNLKRY